jgi:hypothetical protein
LEWFVVRSPSRSKLRSNQHKSKPGQAKEGRQVEQAVPGKRARVK